MPGKGQGCCQPVVAQPPFVLCAICAQVAREVGLGLQLAFRGAVLRGLAVQAAWHIRGGGGGEQGGCLRPCARPLENQPGLGAQQEAADTLPGDQS